MSLTKYLLSAAAVIIIMSAIPYGLSVLHADDNSFFSVELWDKAELKKLSKWKKNLINLYTTVLGPYQEAEDYSFERIDLILLPGMEIYFADGYDDGGHTFVHHEFIVLKPKAGILQVDAKKIDREGNEIAFNGLELCKKEYFKGARILDSQGGDYDSNYEKLHKKTCTDLVPLVTGTIKKAYKQNMVDRAFVIDAASCIAIIVNSVSSAHVVESTQDIDEQRLKDLSMSGKKDIYHAYWVSSIEKITPPVVEINKDGFTVTGFIETDRISSHEFRLVWFRFTWDGSTFTYTQKRVASTRTFIE